MTVVSWCRLAGLFVKPSFYEPLVALQDPLAGLHANTHLAQVSKDAANLPMTLPNIICPYKQHVTALQLSSHVKQNMAKFILHLLRMLTML